jgi:hypothetical protein
MQSTAKLVLFFPFSSAATAGSTLEPDDQATLAAENGTKLSLLMHTNSTDEDFIDVSFAPNPKLIFMESLQIDSPQNITLFLGNTSAMDSFGALTTRQRNLCTTKIKKQIDFGDEIALADFELQTW